MELTRLTIHETKDAIKKGETTYAEVTQAYADRIAQVDPKVKAYLQDETQNAVAAAATFDADAEKAQGALAGIPYALKDNLCTNGIKTTCASKILDNFVPPYNAHVYDNLISEGGVLLGKVNMDEFVCTTTSFPRGVYF